MSFADPIATNLQAGNLFPATPLATNPGLNAFVALCGEAAWAARLADLGNRARTRSLTGRAAQQRYALELALARLSDRKALTRVSVAEHRLHRFAREAVRLADSLPEGQRARMREALIAGLTGEATLIPLFHLLRTAALLRHSGFEVGFSGLTEGTAHDLLAERGGVQAEVVCETISAEDGRPVHRGDWYALVDRINPELHAWLASHPGQHMLKITLPDGIANAGQLDRLQRRICTLLASEQRQDTVSDGRPQAILKLDPLMLGAARGAESPAGGLTAQLRAQFGPEAHLAVVADGGSVLVLAARAGRENDVAAAVARRLGVVATDRLSGALPGIVAVCLEDLDRGEWRGLRDQMQLEGSVRRFLTTAPARRVVAVTCASRFEMFGPVPPDAADAELRFRNPGHPAAKHPGLAPAILSSL